MLKPGGRAFINTTRTNKFGLLNPRILGGTSNVEALGFQVIRELGPLHNRFKSLKFLLSNERPVRGEVLTTILEKLK